MKKAMGAPRRCNKAFVPRVVANRMAISGSGCPIGVPVTSRTANTGASSEQRTSKAVPAGIAPAGDLFSLMTESDGLYFSTLTLG